ncbi:unnamed protein product [Nippostrongylus brasiliensis]|uniref:Uncharacterized protein n=1 Tax=Nippostrongylus brasiliensis TaxID=27835 RepID=A0A0N4Y041_NIPBR|nr:unnamed protein product [Nippostrongylus brasiliensis]
MDPHHLTDDMRYTRVSICQSLLLCPHRKEFLEGLVIGDKSWIFCDSNAHRAVCVPLGENPPTQARLALHLKKLHLCCFWDWKGMLCCELLPTGMSINANFFIAQL